MAETDGIFDGNADVFGNAAVGIVVVARQIGHLMMAACVSQLLQQSAATTIAAN